MRRREVYILSALFVVFITTGFAIDAKSFASNALASAADIIVSVFIAFYLVDRISRRERLLKWRKVKSLSYRAIEATCDLIMFAFQTAPGALLTNTSPSAGKSVPAKQKPQYERFFDLAQEIARKTGELSRMDTIVVDPSIKDPGLPGNVSVEEGRGDGVRRVSDEKYAAQRHIELLHQISSQSLILEVAPHFEKLSLNIFPRILELDEQAELISSFIEVEAAYQEWSSNVDTIEGDWGMPEEYAWEAAAIFCDKMGAMLKIIYAEEHKP